MLEPSRDLRDICAIVGVGNSRLGKVPGVSSLDLVVEAIATDFAPAAVVALLKHPLTDRGLDAFLAKRKPAFIGR